MRSMRSDVVRQRRGLNHWFGVASAFAALASVQPSQAQVAETFIYDVHGRLTGTTEVNAAGVAGWSGYSIDPANNISARSIAAVAFPSTPSRLLENESITLQQTIYSPNNNVTLALQADGDLVLRCGTAVKWSSGTAGAQAQFLVLQGDGHLVLYGPNYTPVWWNGAYGFTGAFLQVQNDGNLVVYTGATPRWSTGTSCGGGGAEIVAVSFSATSNYGGYTGLTTSGGMRDGNFNSANSIHGTNYGTDEIIQADVGVSQAIARIDIAPADASAPGAWGAAYTNGAIVEVSADCATWIYAATVSGAVDGSYTSIGLGGVSVRCIRLRMANNYLGLGDFRVYK